MNMIVRALFLDRDGVINHDAGYTSRWEDFVFIEGIFDLCRCAREKGYLLCVITNQAGIGRGFYTETDFLALMSRMCERFAAEGAKIDRVYYDPTHPEHGLGEYRRESLSRKPNPGMLFNAESDLNLSLPDCVLIGDKLSDILAGQRAGLRTTLLYRPPGVLPTPEVKLAVAPTAEIGHLADAVAWLTAS